MLSPIAANGLQLITLILIVLLSRRPKEAQPCQLIARRSQNELLYVEVKLMEGAIS